MWVFSLRRSAPSGLLTSLTFSFPFIVANLLFGSDEWSAPEHLESRHTRQLHLAQFLPEHASLTCKALHHLTRLRVLFQQIIHILNTGPAALRDTATPGAIDDHMIPPLFRSHGVDDGYHPADLVF